MGAFLSDTPSINNKAGLVAVQYCNEALYVNGFAEHVSAKLILRRVKVLCHTMNIQLSILSFWLPQSRYKYRGRNLKIPFLLALCKETLRRSCMDDGLCNCQLDLAGSVISYNKDRKDWKWENILAKEHECSGVGRM